jgi:hypothetical protein
MKHIDSGGLSHTLHIILGNCLNLGATLTIFMEKGRVCARGNPPNYISTLFTLFTLKLYHKVNYASISPQGEGLLVTWGSGAPTIFPSITTLRV